MITAIAFIVAALIPLGFLVAVKSFDFYQTGSAKFIIYSGIWGILSYFFAAKINPVLVNQGVFSTDIVVRFAAPVVEEILKGLILLYLIRHPDFKYFLDGAIYGFASGIGFAIFENFEYISAHQSTALILAVSRVLSTNLIHATGSALIGIALGLARFNRSGLLRASYLIGGAGLAIAIHSGFNNMVSYGAALIFAFAAGLGGAGTIAAAAIRGLKDEKGWVHENIGLTEGVTTGEASLVQRLDNVDEILAPLAKRFGEEKALQSEKFLFMQAQLAIQGKMLEKMQDEKMRAAIQAQIRELDKKMNVERKAVGSYCMLYLRNIFPASDTQLWNLLQQRVTRNKGEAGTGLWMTLDKRVKPKPAWKNRTDMAEDIASQLKNCFLFKGLSDEALAAVAQKASIHSLAAGDVLMRRGETGNSLFMVNEGWFKIVTEDAQGGELIINKTAPGETIGEMALLDEAPRSASAIALTAAKVLELKKDAFYEILDQRPDVALTVIRSLSARLRFSTTYIEKAINWSQKIAAGDYDFIEHTRPAPQRPDSDDDKAAQLLSAFFQMVRSVKARENDLKQQLERLTLEIDEARRKQEFEDMVSTDFYANLKEQAKRLRAQRAAQDED